MESVKNSLKNYKNEEGQNPFQKEALSDGWTSVKNETMRVKAPKEVVNVIEEGIRLQTLAEEYDALNQEVKEETQKRFEEEADTYIPDTYSLIFEEDYFDELELKRLYDDFNESYIEEDTQATPTIDILFGEDMLGDGEVIDSEEYLVTYRDFIKKQREILLDLRKKKREISQLERYNPERKKNLESRINKQIAILENNIRKLEDRADSVFDYINKEIGYLNSYLDNIDLDQINVTELRNRYNYIAQFLLQNDMSNSTKPIKGNPIERIQKNENNMYSQEKAMYKESLALFNDLAQKFKEKQHELFVNEILNSPEVSSMRASGEWDFDVIDVKGNIVKTGVLGDIIRYIKDPTADINFTSKEFLGAASQNSPLLQMLRIYKQRRDNIFRGLTFKQVSELSSLWKTLEAQGVDPKIFVQKANHTNFNILLSELGSSINSSNVIENKRGVSTSSPQCIPT
jgi:hypothetical protein